MVMNAALLRGDMLPLRLRTNGVTIADMRKPRLRRDDEIGARLNPKFPPRQAGNWAIALRTTRLRRERRTPVHGPSLVSPVFLRKKILRNGTGVDKTICKNREENIDV